MNYYNLSLGTLFFYQTACLLAMDNQPSLPQHIEQEIVKMIVTREPLPAWVPWLIERNTTLASKTTINHVFEARADQSRFIVRHIAVTPCFDLEKHPTYLPEEKKVAIDCTNAFSNHIFLYRTNEDRTISVPLDHRNQSFIELAKSTKCTVDPLGQIFIDIAISRDGTHLVGISEHCIMVWDIQHNILIATIVLDNDHLKSIVDIKKGGTSIVLQNSENIVFIMDLQERTKCTIYCPSHHDNTIYSLYSYAFEDHYCFIELFQSLDGSERHIVITNFYDIAQLFPSLHLDQIKLLSWIHKAATTGNLLSLKGNSPGIIHARRAFNDLPERIKQLVQEFVSLPRWDGCTVS